ncbi:uncharacterized protein LOC144289794 isoform X2 [Canis aureus]
MVQGSTLCACHRIVHEGSLEDRGLVGEVFVPGSLFSAVVKGSVNMKSCHPETSFKEGLISWNSSFYKHQSQDVLPRPVKVTGDTSSVNHMLPSLQYG